MQALTYSTMINAVPSRRAAVLVMLTAYGLNAATAGAATIDAAGVTGGGLLDAIMPNVAVVFSETLTGVLKIIGFGYAALLGVLLAATLCRAHRFVGLPRWSGRAPVADTAVRSQAGAVQ